MSVTIKEVAQRAGVSTATVSRTLNNTGPVDEETRRRVRDAARELHYIPNMLGRSLSTRRTDTIGLLLPDLFGEFFSEVIRGCDRTAQLSRYHLIVSSSHNNRQEIEAAIRTMRGRVDGLVIMSPHIDAGSLHHNLPATLPVVLLNCYVDTENFDALNIDNFAGARNAVAHLAGHGHRRIGIIKGTEHNMDAFERLRGYRSALEDAGIAVSETLEFPGNFSDASGYDAARAMLRRSPVPTAVFVSNDAMAVGAISAFREAGVDVPGAMAVVGFDDIPIASFLTPPLTSVHVDIDNLGALAVESLVQALREKSRHTRRRVLLPTNIVIRESCGCNRPRD